MKKITKKFACLLLVLSVLFTVSAVAASAQSTMNITLRIEGIQSCMFYKTEAVPYTGSLTLQTALKYIDQNEDSIAITGLDSNFISDINGDSSAKFGGWDGWLYKVDNQDISVGIDSYALKDGDSVLLYYGDPYGVGMQFPVADTSKIADGIIKFTSTDTTYDANGNAAVAVNPVVGATVTWNYENTSAAYTTDANGEIRIDPSQLTAGGHGVQIAKINEAGLPLVLRFAPDYVITVDRGVTNASQTTSTAAQTGTTAVQLNSTATDSTTQTTAPASGNAETESPKTGDNSTVYFAVCAAALIGVAVTSKGRKRSYEE